MRRLALIVPLVLATAAEAGPGFWTTGLPQGSYSADVFDLSQDGVVAVGLTYGDMFPGFSWTAATGRYDFGLLPGMPSRSSPAFGVSTDGSVIVGSMSEDFGPKRAYRWTGAGTLVDLGTLHDFPRAYADGVSGDGQIVVGASEYSELTEAYGEAFRWTSQAGMQGLGYLKADGTYSRAHAISRDGTTIVGISQSGGPGGDVDAYTWTKAGGMKQLPGLEGAPFQTTRANAVSADGFVVVGDSPSDTPQGYRHAVRWANGVAEDLGTLPGHLRSALYAVSDSGNVAGGLVYGGDPDAAAVWTSATGLILLTDYLAAHGIDVPSHYQLEEIRAVSGDGLTFAGQFQNLDTGLREGFIATIPAPSSGLVVLAPWAVLRRRRG